MSVGNSAGLLWLAPLHGVVGLETAPPFQPIRFKTRTNQHLVIYIFPLLRQLILLHCLLMDSFWHLFPDLLLWSLSFNFTTLIYSKSQKALTGKLTCRVLTGKSGSLCFKGLRYYLKESIFLKLFNTAWQVHVINLSTNGTFQGQYKWINEWMNKHGLVKKSQMTGSTAKELNSSK